jgi:prophage tail gpP-like protein
MFGTCVSYTLTVMGYVDFSEELYHKNATVSVLSPGAMIYRETKMIVKKATIKHNDSDGEVTTLELVLPGSYTGELPEAFPWEE